MNIQTQNLDRHHTILHNLLMLALGLIVGLVVFLAFNRPVTDTLNLKKQSSAPVPTSEAPQIDVQKR